MELELFKNFYKEADSINPKHKENVEHAILNNHKVFEDSNGQNDSEDQQGLSLK